MGNWFKRNKKTAMETIPVSVRSSSEQSFSGGIDNLVNFYGGINPYVPIEYYQYLTLLSIVNPDMSQAITNWMNIGNTGHRLIIQDKNGKAVDVAIERLNEKAYTTYKISAGVDGLINHYFNQLAVSGAISSEDVLQDDLKGVKKTVIVPTYSIRFKYDNGEYRAYQDIKSFGKFGKNLIKLSELTYSYYAGKVVENSPYAVPPMIAALGPISTQRDMFESVKYGVKKFGLMGLNVLKVPKITKRVNELEKEYQLRYQKYIKNVADSVSDNYSKGILVLPDEINLEHHALSADSRGVKDTVQIIEEQVFSGIGTDPAMHGRSYSTTETYAGVVYNILLNTIGNMRRLIKRRQEKTYRLDLMLAGLDIEDISFRFNPDKRLNPNTEALADRYNLNNIIEKVKSGMISPEQGAQEAGYSEWYDDELLKQAEQEGSAVKEFVFNRQSQQYELKRRNYDIESLESKIESLENEEVKEVDDEKKLNSWIRKYLGTVIPYFNKLDNDVLEYAKNYLEDKLIESGTVDMNLFVYDVRAFVASSPQYKALKEKTFKEDVNKVVVDAGKYFKVSDKSALGDRGSDTEFHFGTGDKRAMDMFSKVDNFYFSKFVDNNDFGGEIKKYISKFLERGEGNFGNWTKDAELEFKAAFGADLHKQMKRIIDSSIPRIRNYAHIEQLYEDGFEYLEVNEVMDYKTCNVCREMHKRLVPVGKMRNVIQGFVNSESVDESLEFIKKSGLGIKGARKPIHELIKEGKGVPPYHVACRGSVQGHFEFDDRKGKNYEPKKPKGNDLDRKAMYDYWKSLTPYERNNKIRLAIDEGIAEGFELRGKANWEKHKKELHGVKNIDEMKKKAIEVLKNPERILLNVDNSGKQRPGFMYNFFKGKGTDWLQVTVDIDGTIWGAGQKPVILHAYGHRDNKEKNVDKRIEDLVTTNKFLEINNG